MPARRAYPPPTRASARVASRASSASGELEEANNANIVSLKASVEKRRHEENVKDAQLSVKNDELAAANELLRKERDAARDEANRRHLRDVYRRDALVNAEIQREAEALAQRMVAEELEKRDARLANTELASNTSRPASVPSLSAESTEPTASPASASSPQVETPRPRHSTSLLRRVLTGVASPFFRGTASLPRIPPSRAEGALGELPVTRKRSLPEPEPVTEPAPEPVTPIQNKPRMKAHKAPATMPTTLTTISERNEASEQNITMVDATPCRPRPISKVRAARQGITSTPNRSWASRPSHAAITPRQPNADIRRDELQKQGSGHHTAMTKKAQEVAAAPPRPTKRVKVDQLLYIPHNRPGDSEGTFRVPDIDSDDEMEVDINVPLRPNLFSESQSLSEKTVPNAKSAGPDRAVEAKQATHSSAVMPPNESRQTSKETLRERKIQHARLNQEVHNAKRFLKHSKPQHAGHYKDKLRLAEQALQRFQQRQGQSSIIAEADDGSMPRLPIYHFPRLEHGFAPRDPKDQAEQKYLATKFGFGMLHWQRTGQLLNLRDLF